jgi:hypothetical protein
VRATYYGMLFFRASIGNSSVVYKPTASERSTLLKTWATYDTVTKQHSIMIIHKDTTPDRIVTVQMPIKTVLKGQVITMTAPSLVEKEDISVAGLTLKGSVDGLPIESSKYDGIEITSDAQGVFKFTAKKASATLLRVYNPGDEVKPIIKLDYSKEMETIVKEGGGPNYVPLIPVKKRSAGERITWSFNVGMLGCIYFILLYLYL